MSHSSCLEMLCYSLLQSVFIPLIPQWFASDHYLNLLMEVFPLHVLPSRHVKPANCTFLNYCLCCNTLRGKHCSLAHCSWQKSMCSKSGSFSSWLCLAVTSSGDHKFESQWCHTHPWPGGKFKFAVSWWWGRSFSIVPLETFKTLYFYSFLILWAITVLSYFCLSSHSSSYKQSFLHLTLFFFLSWN